MKSFALLDDDITGGKVNVDIQYGVLHFFSGVYDLCDKFKEAGLTCPVRKGTVSRTSTLSKCKLSHVTIIMGYFLFTINATTSAGDEESCFTLEMNNN